MCGVRMGGQVTIPWPTMTHDPATPASGRRQRNTEASKFLSTWRELVKFQQSGRTRNIGIDGFVTWQIERLLDQANTPPPVFHILDLSLQHGKTEEVRFCQAHAIECLAVLRAEEALDSESRGLPPERNEERPRTGVRYTGRGDIVEAPLEKTPNPLMKIGQAIERSPLQVLVTWALQRGMVVAFAPFLPDPTSLSTATAYTAWQAETRRMVADTYALLHPFARRPLFCSNVRVHRVMLTVDQMRMLEALDMDLAGQRAGVNESVSKLGTSADFIRAMKEKRKKGAGDIDLTPQKPAGAKAWDLSEDPEGEGAEEKDRGKIPGLLEEDAELAFMETVEDGQLSPDEKLQSLLNSFFNSEVQSLNSGDSPRTGVSGSEFQSLAGDEAGEGESQADAEAGTAGGGL